MERNNIIPKEQLDERRIEIVVSTMGKQPKKSLEIYASDRKDGVNKSEPNLGMHAGTIIVYEDGERAIQEGNDVKIIDIDKERTRRDSIDRQQKRRPMRSISVPDEKVMSLKDYIKKDALNQFKQRQKASGERD